MDREKVIKDIKAIRAFCDIKRDKIELPIIVEAFEDWKTILDDAIELLKEQEPIKPKSKVRHGENCQYQHWCGNCMVMLHGKPKFCPNCGRKVKWG